MRINKMILTSILALSCTANALAFAKSSNIPIEDVTIKAGARGEIKLLELYSGIFYDVTCKISDLANPNSSPDDVVFSIKQPMTSRYELFIDGYKHSLEVPQTINSRGSVFTVLNVQDNDLAITIKNLDYKDSLTVSNCIATIHH